MSWKQADPKHGGGRHFASANGKHDKGRHGLRQEGGRRSSQPQPRQESAEQVTAEQPYVADNGQGYDDQYADQEYDRYASEYQASHKPLSQPPASRYVPSPSYGVTGENQMDYLNNDPVEKKRRKNKTPIIIALVIVVAILAGGAFFWFNRPVKITVNGQEVTEARGASLSQVVKDQNVQVTPGNLLSVKGDVLKEGQGQPFSAKVGGNDLDQAAIDSYKVSEGDDISFGNGADKSEIYEVTKTTETQPKLKMNGDGNFGAIAYISQWGKAGKTETRTGKVSGQTNDVSVQDVQDCIIYLHSPKPDNGQKLVALTFDDGPSEYTQRYLDILAQYHAKATFFELGQNVREMPQLSKAVLAAGHQIASHTDSHKDLTTLDEPTLQSEISKSLGSIKDATGVQTTVVRPPYGSFRERNWLHTKGLMSTSVLWTQDSKDWELPGVDQIVANSTVNIQPGSIILMHDGGGNRDQDLEALPKIIQSLQQQGYTFVTIDELMASDSSIPKEVASGNYPMPADAVWPTELGDA